MVKSGQALYVSVEVWRALMLIAKKEETEPHTQRARIADEVADRILRETIPQKYPEIFKAAKLDAELIKQTLPK